jgi:hypothetical protein
MRPVYDQKWLSSQIGSLPPPRDSHAPRGWLRLAIVDDLGHRILEALETTKANWITIHDFGETKTGTLDQIDFQFRDGWNQVGWSAEGQWILVYGEWNNVGILYYKDMPLVVQSLLTEEYLAQSPANYLAHLSFSDGDLSPTADEWARLLFE